ncbi:radical SAM protein [bacterium]|nr:radical SAM protein [bacterium]
MKIIRIETMKGCNAKCSFCPLGAGTHKRKLGRMSSEFFFKIVDQARALGYEIEVIGMNEPLMEPRIFEFFDYIEKSGGKQIIYTNASLLTKEMASKLLQYQYNKFIFSFHGGNKETYERVMGLDFEEVVSNIKYMISWGRIPNYLISMRTCKDNESSIGDFKRLWKGYRYDISKALDWINMFDGGGERGKCHYLWIPSVFWDGRVAFCCMDAEGEVILGDLKKQSLEEILGGQVYQNYLHFNKRHKLNQLYPCNVCRAI